MSTTPFLPSGNTVAIASAATATTAVQVPNFQGKGVGAGPTQYEIQVIGTVPMFFTWASVTVNAATGVPAPTIAAPGTPGTGYLVQAGQAKVISAPPEAFFSTIASGTGSSAYITPGDGL